MRQIDFETWPRRQHFDVYSQYDHPHFNMCANVELTTLFPFLKEQKISFTIAMVYILTRAANEIPEFRQRIRKGHVVEHERIHPSITLLKDDDLFTFCTFVYALDFPLFKANALKQMAHMKENPTLEDEPGQDDLLYMTAIPWVSFTSFMHPANHDPSDSVPRIAWGKFFQEGDLLKMPLSVQGHHALMDGLHMGRYYGKVQDYLHQTGVLLDAI
jgi:chloramphenicol O-acetyltransferase type A